MGGRGRSEKGFAKAWTNQFVLMQVLWQISYYRGAREFWADAGQVKRRVIEPQWLGRSARAYAVRNCAEA